MKSQFILIGMFLFALLSCVEKKSPPIIVQNPPIIKHLQYFGFALVDTYWDDPTDGISKTVYNDEVYPFCNTADIILSKLTDTIINRVNDMNSLGMKPFIHLSDLFFEYNGTNGPSGNDYKLRKDYKQRWNTFFSINNSVLDSSKVLAFYIGEEPTWLGVSFAELKSAADYIKISASAIPIMIIEAYPAIARLQIPKSVDWVGFDQYFIKDPANDIDFLNNLKELKGKLSTANQRLVFVMDAHYIPAVHGAYAGITINEMEEVANSYYELAKSEARTIALLGYFWPNGFDDSSAIGARGMPQKVLDNYKRIGKEITGK